jgi:predicted SAM-dependent methyltransferase
VATPQSGDAAPAVKPDDPPPRYLEARDELAYRYLAGEGLEIGALNWPLKVPAWAKASNVDRMTPEELREHYPEMAEVELTEVDVIDDGERLESIADESQDFIIANHFLEHTADPIGTIGNHLAKLKPGGVLFYAVPDKRYTFDFRRGVTTLEHLIQDHEQGPEGSRREHYDEWGQLVVGTAGDREDPRWPERGEELARQLEAEDFSIHQHTWTADTFLELVRHCQRRFDEGLEVEATARREMEIVVVLRKAGTYPEPKAPAETAPELAAEVRRLGAQVRRQERALDANDRELRRLKQSSSWRVTEPLRSAKARLYRRR